MKPRIMQLKVKDGNFVWNNGFYVRFFNPEFVRGNGWECQVQKNGVKCKTCKIEDNCKKTIEFSILDDGYVTLVLRVNGKAKLLKRTQVQLNNGKIPDGYIELSDGEISKRTAEFKIIKN